MESFPFARVSSGQSGHRQSRDELKVVNLDFGSREQPTREENVLSRKPLACSCLSLSRFVAGEVR